MGRLPLLALALAAGCAPMGFRTTSVKDAPVSQRAVEVPHAAGSIVKVEQQGVAVKVEARHACKLVEKVTVQRTVERERVNQAPWLDYTLAGGGVALAATGVGVLADSGSVYRSDARDGRYNPIGPGNARIIGAGLTGIGLVLGSAALVDVFRGQAKDRRTREVELPGKTLNERVPCASSPIAEAEVALGTDAGTRPTFAGATSLQGTLSFDLDVVVPKGTPLSSAGQLAVFVEDARVGEVSQAPLLALREDRDWSALPIAGCVTPSAAAGCDPVRSFLDRYPAGAHAAAATAMLKEAEPKLAELREAAAWQAVQGAIGPCKKAPTLTELDVACAPLADFVRSFPAGPHAAELLKTLAAVEKKRERLEKKGKAP